MSFTAEVITALGGLTGFSSVIAAVATFVQTKRIHARITPNHGSSLSDGVDRIEAKLSEHGETIRRIETEQTKTAADALIARHSVESLAREVKGLGHEIGDLRSTRDRDHGDYDERIRKLEASPR